MNHISSLFLKLQCILKIQVVKWVAAEVKVNVTVTERLLALCDSWSTTKGTCFQEFTGSARFWHLWQSFKENMDSNLVCFLIIESCVVIAGFNY